VLLCGLAFQARWKLGQLRESHPPEGRFVEVDGFQLHYLRAGEGPAVLLLHGSPGRVEDWTLTMDGQPSVFESLSADFTVIALDRPGNGWSPLHANGPTGLIEQADLVPRFLEAIDVPRAVLVGHSYGGGLILGVAVRHPEVVAGLVFVAGVAYPHDFADGLMRVMAFPGVGSVFRWSLVPIVFPVVLPARLQEAAGPNPVSDAYREAFVPFFARPDNLLQMSSEQIALGEEMARVAAGYAMLATPLWIVVGDADDPVLLDHARRLAVDVPGARLEILPSLGHFVPHVRPDAVVAAVRRAAESLPRHAPSHQ